MAKKMKWIGVLAALLLAVSCFTPWVIFKSKGIIVSGIDEGSTNFGRYGYFHFFLIALFIVFSLVKRIWAKRINIPVAGVNLAWAVKNYFVLTACSAGECPQTQTGMWLMLLASFLMLVASFFPDIDISSPPRKN